MTSESLRGDGVPTRRAVVFHYSQTGQLTEAVHAFTAPLAAAGWHIRQVVITPARPYPFPWSIREFFGVFPTSVDDRAHIELATPESEFHTAPDELIVLAYQVWYLSPSVPMRTVLNTYPEMFADREVVSVVACRKMWYSAVLDVDHRLTELGARHLGAAVATDTRPQLITLITTLRWMFGGRRRSRGPLGRAGIDDRELDRLRECATAWSDPSPAAMERTVIGAPVKYPVAGADLMAGRLFRRWGRMIRAAIRRSPALGAVAVGAFVAWLGLSLVILPPGVLLALPLHRRIDRAIDRRLGDIPRLARPTATETASTTVEPGDLAPRYRLHRHSGEEITVPDLCDKGFLLLCGEEAEPRWLDAIGYVRIMDTTPIAALTISRTAALDGQRVYDPSGNALDGYGLHGGSAVLVGPGGVVAAVLRGADPHQELIRAMAAGLARQSPIRKRSV